MTETADLSDMQQAARLCYRLFEGPLVEADIPPEGLIALQSVLGSPVSAGELLQVTNRLRNHQNFAEVHTNLMANWQARLESVASLSDDDALAFMQALFGTLDHAALYDHGVNASISLHKRGSVIGVEMQYPGNMPCWTVHLTTGGTGLLLNEQMEARVERGDMMLFHPQARYHSGLHPAAEYWEHFWALFQPRPHWNEWLNWHEIDEGILVLHLPDEQSTAAMESLFNDLVSLRDDPSPQQNDLQHNRLEEILIRTSAYKLESPQKSLDKRVQHACDYMQGHMAERFSIDNVAAACNLSTSRLAHLFKEHMGVSPKSWSNDLRLQQARKLLLAGRDSIARIASMVGYEDPNQFTRYFTKNMGCSPRAFRQAFLKRKIS